MGRESLDELRELGELLAFLKEPEPPKGFRDAWEKLPIFRKVLSMNPKVSGSGPCQEHVIEGDDVDLSQLPIQTCWPGDAGPLVTWPLVITRGPNKDRQNLGIYRQQLIGGPAAFVMRANDYDDYVRAIRLKLLKEIRSFPISDSGDDETDGLAYLLSRPHIPPAQ